MRRRAVVVVGLVVVGRSDRCREHGLRQQPHRARPRRRGTLHTGSGTDEAIVWGPWVPRTLIGATVGGRLGVAGLLMQGHTRNPLADPGLFGVSAGAGLAVVLGVYVFGITNTGVTVWFALAGAVVASVVVFSVTIAGSGTRVPCPWRWPVPPCRAARGRDLVHRPDRPASLDAYRLWVVGSLSGRQLDVSEPPGRSWWSAS